MDIAQAISEYGFPIVATVGLLYMIYFIWGFITNNIKKKLSENKLEWSMTEITEQCILGKISKEQAHKLLDRKGEILKQKSRDLLKRKTND